MDVKPPLKIALCGRMRSGKDTVAEYLVANYGFKRFAFGDSIREVCHQLYPEQFEDGAKPRALLQGVGQSLRTFDEDVWVKRVLRLIEMYHAQIRQPNVVISDLRQPNEYAALKRKDFVIIRVNASDELRVKRMESAGDAYNPADLAHKTESYVDKFRVHYDVYNTADLSFLFEQIDRIIADIQAK